MLEAESVLRSEVPLRLQRKILRARDPGSARKRTARRNARTQRGALVRLRLKKSIVEALLFPEATPKPEQLKAIELLLAGENTLCLMPTGSGKSFVYQYAAAHLGKTALVLSPLRALMSQQDEIVNKSGFTSAALHELNDYRKYTNTLRTYANTGLPQFLY